jgi:predicted ATP-grasp superfamily ATP-dependent carboligase
MPQTLPLPPVVVMNPYYSGVGIARALRGRGVQLIALSWEPGVAGAKSRLFDKVLMAPNGRDQPEALCEFLVGMRGDFPCKPVIFPTRDFDVIFLERYRNVLAERYVLPQPEGSPILRMMDKLELADVATGLGLKTPRTISCKSAEDLDARASSMQFPVIAKPRFAFQWRQKGSWERVGAQKAFIVEGREELRALYARLATVTQELLIQEYVPGVDSDIVVCCVYIGRDGEPRGYFTGRKLQQSPPLVGTGSVVEAVDCPEIVGPTQALLGAFGYTGIAEVEFKYDRATREYNLIEINPRHWDQHELGTLVGINISWLAYSDMLGIASETVRPKYAPGARYVWVAEREFTFDLARRVLAAFSASPGSGRWRKGMSGAAGAMREAAQLVRGQRIYALSRLADPVPGASTAWNLLKDLLLAAGRRLQKA